MKNIPELCFTLAPFSEPVFDLKYAITDTWFILNGHFSMLYRR